MPFPTLCFIPASLLKTTTNKNAVMKKKLTLCFFAVLLYAQAQDVTRTNNALQPGWITTYSANGMGLLSTDGTTILEPVYDELRAFNEVTAGLAVIVQNGLCGLIDINGNIVSEPLYDAILPADGFNPDWIMVSLNGKFGFIDTTGTEAVPIMYD
jgi:hypothetical protein